MEISKLVIFVILFVILLYGLFASIEVLFCIAIGVDPKRSFLLRFLFYIREKLIKNCLLERIRKFYED